MDSGNRIDVRVCGVRVRAAVSRGLYPLAQSEGSQLFLHFMSRVSA